MQSVLLKFKDLWGAELQKLTEYLGPTTAKSRSCFAGWHKLAIRQGQAQIESFPLNFLQCVEASVHLCASSAKVK